jgi:hypothetical protein
MARTLGFFFVDAATSFIGPVILEPPLYRLIPTNSALGVIVKEWTLSILLAGGLGFLAYRTLRTKTARMIWLLFFLWFAFGVATHLPVSSRQISIGSLWAQFSGVECAASLRKLDCQAFFLFTIPFVRGVAYSSGAVLAAWIYRLTLARNNPSGAQR